MKAYLKLNNDVEQTLITELIKTARMKLEGFTGRSFGAKTLKTRFQYVDGWVELPYSPITSITSVVNDANQAITYESRGLEVKEIFCANDTGVIVTYVAGYTTLPSELKTAIKKQVATDYWNRENFVIGESVNDLSNEAKYHAKRFSRNTILGLGF
jgi:uncharacterized phiE125 gp8 family phage protein